MTDPTDSTPILLDYRQASQRLGIRLGTLRGYVHRHQIPHVRLSPRKVGFEPAALDAWLAERRVPVASPHRELTAHEQSLEIARRTLERERAKAGAP